LAKNATNIAANPPPAAAPPAAAPEPAAYSIVRAANTDARRAPGVSLCAIRAYRTGETVPRESGTAWAVAPRKVVTAAHVVFSRSGEFDAPVGAASVITVVAGIHQFGLPALATLGFNRVTVHPAYENGTNPALDIAVITLDGDLPAQCLPLTLNPLNDAQIDDATIDIMGYPLHVDFNNANPGGEQIYVSNGRIVRRQPLTLGYDTYIYGGQSGSPIFIAGAHANGVMGLHLAGAKDSGAKGNGLRFTDTIRTWIDGI
jgi:V8-like Glu-specific endopeptidase